MLPKLTEPVQYLQELDASLRDLVASVKAQGLEGLVAKRRDSRYEPGLRSGAWQKMRVNQGQEFVIGGYTVGSKTFDALDLRVLRGRPADLRRADAQRVHAGRARAVDEEVPRAGNEGVPVRESARGEERPVGSRADEGEDEGLPLAEAGAGGAVRVPGVDGREPPAALEVHRPARGQEGARRQARMSWAEPGGRG